MWNNWTATPGPSYVNVQVNNLPNTVDFDGYKFTIAESSNPNVTLEVYSDLKTLVCKIVLPHK